MMMEAEMVMEMLEIVLVLTCAPKSRICRFETKVGSMDIQSEMNQAFISKSDGDGDGDGDTVELQRGLGTVRPLGHGDTGGDGIQQRT